MHSLSRTARRCAAVIAALAWSHSAQGAKIACVGDSITFGYGLNHPDTESYPVVLAARLGTDHTVKNFGVSGATLLKNGDKPYWKEASFTASESFGPDVVVVMLGTNDAKPQNWSHKTEFVPDYLELIAHYRSLGALVYVATPPPVYAPGAFDIAPNVVASEIVPLVRTIASDAKAPLADVFTALSGKAEDFPDTVHPNAAGAALIAGAIQAALQANGFGGGAMTAGAGGVGQGGRANGGAGGASTGGAGQGGAIAEGGRDGGGGGRAGSAGVGGGMLAGRGGANGEGGTGAGGVTGSAGTVGMAATGGSGGSGSAGMPNAAGDTQRAGGEGGRMSSDEPRGGQADEGDGCGCKFVGSGLPPSGEICAALAAMLARVLRRRRTPIAQSRS